MSRRYLSDAYMQEVRNRVDQNVQPVSAAYKALITTAAEGLNQAPISIRDNGGSPWYRQDAVYVPSQDGVVNDQSNRKCGEMAKKLGRVCCNLALAWRLTGETQYAEKAIHLIHVWCINENTRMFPSGSVIDAWTPGAAYGGDVVLYLAFQDLFKAIHLLADYSEWDMLARAGVKRWVKSMIEYRRELMFFNGVEMYNNWEGARLSYLAFGALVIDDLDLLAYIFDRYRHILPMMMTDEGELPRETMRTRSMSYTLSALRHIIDIAEIAKQQSIDLYNLSVNGRCLKTAVDYAAHHLLHIDQWPFQLIRPVTEELKNGHHLALFEMVYKQWGDQRYIDVINTYSSRPVTAEHATLLFAAG